jgi:hypothetical protein
MCRVGLFLYFHILYMDSPCDQVSCLILGVAFASRISHQIYKTYTKSCKWYDDFRYCVFKLFVFAHCVTVSCLILGVAFASSVSHRHYTVTLNPLPYNTITVTLCVCVHSPCDRVLSHFRRSICVKRVPPKFHLQMCYTGVTKTLRKFYNDVTMALWWYQNDVILTLQLCCNGVALANSMTIVTPLYISMTPLWHHCITTKTPVLPMLWGD